jgi:hypothetical protein
MDYPKDPSRQHSGMETQSSEQSKLPHDFRDRFEKVLERESLGTQQQRLAQYDQGDSKSAIEEIKQVAMEDMNDVASLERKVQRLSTALEGHMEVAETIRGHVVSLKKNSRVLPPEVAAIEKALNSDKLSNEVEEMVKELRSKAEAIKLLHEMIKLGMVQ